MKYRRLLGRRAVATGTLYLGFTGHHKTPVLLRVNTLAEAKSLPEQPDLIPRN